jgi:valyl-tRNA synthetase
MQIDKVYEPQRFEPRWADWWISSGIYHADPERPGRHFSLVIPPPNVTGSLHMGHMLDHTIIDVAVRWHRMSGDNTVWFPGMDHAGIATQMVVTRELQKEGKTRQDLGREAFEERVWEWKKQYGGTIKHQMERMGVSCDWSRERFTLDPGLSRAVREIFVRLYEKGLVYRGEYMVNWCPHCNTALSDLEVVHEDTQGHLWHIRYPVNGMEDRSVVVATTRPETMLGDTAVAVNPKDARYSDLRGRTVTLPLMNREIPVIFDEVADPKFGTGVVKVTPAHDLNDFEAGKRHNLAKIKVIGENAAMTAEAGVYAGLDRMEARRRVVAALEESGLMVKIEPYPLSVGKCQRCKTVVEPLISTQWFVKMKPLAEPAIKAVENGDIKLIPENWAKTYYEWMYNIRDWCISRQLWWGHRIPAWHCATCGKATVSREDASQCAHCGSAEITQDTDVLDTWFSSGLWPFSVMGWPDKTPDLDRYYPTTLMVTGFDILFFWVARMIMMGLECMGEVPFRQVYMHGLVRDAERQKMSKTKGNVIDPLVITEQYGTDAVRLSLLIGAGVGNDIAMTEDRMASARAFANKIWNATRFILMKMEASGVEPWIPAVDQPLEGPEAADDAGAAPLEDRWIFSRLNARADAVNRALETHRYHEAAHTLWQFFWGEFCDWYIELKKLRLKEGSGLDAHWRNLLTVYERALRLLHPVMPFLTEELWQRFAEKREGRPASISLAAYPQYSHEAADLHAEHEMELLREMISAVRDLRADMKIDLKQELEGVLYAHPDALPVAKSQLEAIERLGNVKLELHSEAAPKLEGAVRSTPDFDLLLRVKKGQAAAQKARLEKEVAQLQKLIADKQRQLSNEKFLAGAPAQVVADLKAKMGDYEAQLAKSQSSLAGLGE